MKVPSESLCSTGLERLRPNYYVPQTLPNGFYVTDALITLVLNFNSGIDVTSECSLLVKSFLCSALYAPCNNVTEQPLKLCASSCQFLNYVANGSQCQNALRLLRGGSNNPELLDNILNQLNCTNTATYFFGDAQYGFSNSSCYDLIQSDGMIRICALKMHF